MNAPRTIDIRRLTQSSAVLLLVDGRARGYNDPNVEQLRHYIVCVLDVDGRPDYLKGSTLCLACLLGQAMSFLDHSMNIEPSGWGLLLPWLFLRNWFFLWQNPAVRLTSSNTEQRAIELQEHTVLFKFVITSIPQGAQNDLGSHAAGVAWVIYLSLYHRSDYLVATGDIFTDPLVPKVVIMHLDSLESGCLQCSLPPKKQEKRGMQKTDP